MGASQTAAEVRAGHIAAMGQELGEFFYAATNELIWMHWRWNQHRTLFGEKQSRVDLLNKTAPLFFHILHKVLFEDTLLAIARLVGSPESFRKPNLSIQRLPRLLTLNRNLNKELNGLVQTAVKVSQFAVDWRHRHIAHRDLDLTLQRNVPVLLPAMPAQVEASLSALRTVLNRVEMAYCNSHTAYDGSSISIAGDAEALLHYLNAGFVSERQRMERLKRGEPRDEDLAPPKAP